MGGTVGVAVSVGVGVGVAVSVGVAVAVGSVVGVLVIVPVGEAVGVGVRVGTSVGVMVGVGVGVSDGVGVGVGASQPHSSWIFVLSGAPGAVASLPQSPLLVQPIKLPLPLIGALYLRQVQVLLPSAARVDPAKIHPDSAPSAQLFAAGVAAGFGPTLSTEPYWYWFPLCVGSHTAE